MYKVLVPAYQTIDDTCIGRLSTSLRLKLYVIHISFNIKKVYKYLSRIFLMFIQDKILTCIRGDNSIICIHNTDQCLLATTARGCLENK